jgi:transcriptional regulator with XRE-family HTH domain
MGMIGKNIQAAREMRNMSKQELARKARIGVQTIEKYETGEKTPEVQTILKISTVLDIPASELLEKACSPDTFVIDSELEQLIREIGPEMAKHILRNAKQDLLKA